MSPRRLDSEGDSKKSKGGISPLAWAGIFGVGCGCGGLILLMLGAALFLPAIQAAREAARRSQCRNNVKQISLAIMSYEETFRVYPQGVRVPDRAVDTPGSVSCWHWYADILPFMEQKDAYDALGVATTDAASWNLAEMQPTRRGLAVQCPSDGGAVAYTVQPVAGPDTFQYRSNYAAAHNTGAFELKSGVGTGAFVVNASRRLKNISDGSSSTLFVAEKGTGRPDNPRSAAAAFCVPRLSGPESLSACFVTNAPVNLAAGSLEERSRGASSPHTGGAHVAFCDGAVRYISGSIDADTLRRLIDIADGEQVVLPD